MGRYSRTDICAAAQLLVLCSTNETKFRALNNLVNYFHETTNIGERLLKLEPQDLRLKFIHRGIVPQW